jgi:hypothetical protein
VVGLHFIYRVHWTSPNVTKVGGTYTPFTIHWGSMYTPLRIQFGTTSIPLWFHVLPNLFHLNLMIRHNFISYKIFQHWCHSYPIGIIHLGSIIYTSHKLYFNGFIVIPTWTHLGIHKSFGFHKNIPNYYTTFERRCHWSHSTYCPLEFCCTCYLNSTVATFVVHFQPSMVSHTFHLARSYKKYETLEMLHDTWTLVPIATHILAYCGST